MALQLIQHLSTSSTKYNKLTAEYFLSFGSKIESQNNNTLLTNNGTSFMDGWNSAYGSIVITPKKHHQYCWVFIIRQHHKNINYGAIAIGIEQIKKSNHHQETYFHGQTSTKHYAFTSDGKRYSHLHPNGIRFSDKYNDSDSMVMMLIDGYTLSFCVVSPTFIQTHNIHSIDQYIETGAWIVAEKHIVKDIKYRMVVSLYGKTKLFGDKQTDQSSVELLNYAWIAKEREDEIDDDFIQQFLDEQCEESEDIEGENELKNAIVSLEQQMTEFENKFDIETLHNGMIENRKYLEVISDVNALKKRLESLGKHVVNMDNYILSVMYPDITQYESWDIPQMLQWISSLDDGVYVKYLNVLKRGFKSDSILKGEMLCNLTTNDLRNEPFNIKSFPVRQKLIQYFQTLKRGNKGYNAYANQYEQQVDEHSIEYEV